MANSRCRQDYINAWKRNHPERRREWYRRDRLAKYREQYLKQDGLCFWCMCELSDNYTVDHVAPRSRGGYDNLENIVLACRSCNSGRRDDISGYWRPVLTYTIPIVSCWTEDIKPSVSGGG